MVVASVIDSLSKIGAITGIISFIGIGLLILLVAAQSRQIRAMKEWIDAEPERQAETAQRVIAEVQRRITAARERRAAAAGQTVAPPPARTVAPAPGTLGATPEAKAVAAAKGADATVSSAPTEVVDPAAGSVPPPTGGENGSAGGPPVFAPLTPAADAGAGEAGAPPVDPDEPQAGDLDPLAAGPIEVGQETQPADALPSEYDPLAAATPAARATDPRFADEHFDLDHPHEEPRGNRVLFGIGAAALVAGIVLAVVLLFGGGDDKSGSPSGDGSSLAAEATPTPKANDSKTTPVDPASVKVVVLNGTRVNGLAQNVTDDLTGKGYTTSQPNTLSSDQSRTTTTVEYRAGHASEAKQVAKDLGIPESSVQPIEADVSAAAPETANVVVVTGQDLANTTSGTTTGGE